MNGRLALALAAVVAPLAASTVVAQPLGTFRWQLAPYCNVVTLYVVQQGAGFTLTGTDDQCGGLVTAPASGTAHINPNGSIGIGLTTIRPDGITIATNVVLNPTTISGDWQDEYSNGGTFQFNPASPVAGSPRRITLTGVYSVFFHADAANEVFASAISFGRTLPAPPLSAPSNIIPVGGPPTADCPGSHTNPQALPGQLCLYERSRLNVQGLVVTSALLSVINRGERTGAQVVTSSAGIGPVRTVGFWAVTIP